ncbi:MAG TPA: M23 family metallopeptidase [Terracidiphilus sp.]|nr:M23 family metallopeptidase [Terracidiphilus sp.]
MSTLRLAALLAVLTASALAQSVPAQTLTLTPPQVASGSPVLLSVSAPSATSIDGDWLDHAFTFFRGEHNAWFALAGVDVEAPAGPSTLTVHIHAASGTRDLTQSVEIHTAHYRTTTLTVAPRFVAPPPADLKQIEAEQKLKVKIFSTSAATPLWHGDFHAPVHAVATDSFGTRRVFNDSLDSIHKGMDYRARTGTPVRASNSGVVVLARKLYFEGNCVVLDHGLGLYTLSMHLSRIRVREGQHVATGALLGLSGATGRVTGPHLHWAVRWQNSYLDPAQLLRLDLNSTQLRSK